MSAKVPFLPVKLGSRDFLEHKERYFRWMLEEAPLCRGRVSLLKPYFLSRYEDCVAMCMDTRLLRNRGTATGGWTFPIPLPKSVRCLISSMITEDLEKHTRLRNLVAQAFTPLALKKLEQRIELLTVELIEKIPETGVVDLMTHYSLPIPVTVIQEMLGIPASSMPQFVTVINTITDGFSGWRIFKSFFFELPKAMRFMEELIELKRKNPGEDILTGLIEAEESGDKLTHEELLSMTFLLIFAGFETTVHLITNGVATLLQHPEQLQRLKEDESLIDTAVEEILRFAGPIQGTKPGYAKEKLELRGVSIPRGSMVIPILSAANRDPRVFENPDVFDISRDPNKHLGFGYGPHYCLGASLARMETKAAILTLFQRFPNLQLGVPENELEFQELPLWQRYRALPVKLRN